MHLGPSATKRAARGIIIQSRKHKPLDWQTIADAAIALADHVGLEKLSLRAVAMRLGVTPMALYKHISDKAELDAIVSTGVLNRSMRKVLHACAAEMRRAFQLRPTLLPIFIQFPYHPRSQHMGGLMTSALVRAGVHEDKALDLFSMLSILVVGEILTRSHYAKGRPSSGFDRARLEAVPHPPIAERIVTSGLMDFEVMLDLQLNLIATMVAKYEGGQSSALAPPP